jgi:hypothetical protein
MKTIAWIGLALGMMAGATYGQKVSPADLLKFRFPATNTPATSAPSVASHPVAEPAAVSSGYFNTNPLIPLIQFSDVPITTGIENLARQAGINYILRSDLFADEQGNPAAEPAVDCKWKNITARDALLRLCDEHGLSLVENPYTHIARIVRAGQPGHFIDARLLGLGTNLPPAGVKESTNNIPLMQFSDVPLDTALINLIEQSGRPVELASNLMEHAAQFIDVNGAISFTPKLIYKSGQDLWFQPMPEVSLRWEGITAPQAIAALCENYDLEIVTDAETGDPEIVPRKFKRHHRVGH